jgi:hypothetical protein
MSIEDNKINSNFDIVTLRICRIIQNVRIPRIAPMKFKANLMSTKFIIGISIPDIPGG